jgi:hypothetical protein
MAKATKYTNNFEVGKVVHVFRTKGCRELSKGRSSSERLDGEYPNIESSEDLLVVENIDTMHAMCQRQDGTQVRVSINHINGDSDYYSQRVKSREAKGEKTVEEQPNSSVEE